jgi:hypothetical protein
MELKCVDKPEDCTLLIGIPISLQDYDQYKSGELQSDFLTRCCTTRVKFYNEVCEPVANSLGKITKYGCKICPKVSEYDIKNAFEKRVVIIFSHWDNKTLEVNGQMVPDASICNLIPKNFNGIIDVCACQPEDHFTVALKNQAPAATVKCTLTKITPAFWIEIIQLTLYLLRRYNIDYREASTLVLKQIFKTYNKTYKPEL